MYSVISEHNARHDHLADQRSGFTLVEMLISVALVLLMMTLFAQVFELASESITLQQALAENDQQLRTFVTIMRADLRKRTFRDVVPFREDQGGAGSLSPFIRRRGYFYISTNDPNNPRDTVLQFTMQSTITSDSSDETEYAGRASALVGSFLDNANQPEHDDGQGSVNGATMSSAAQVSYFLRSGRLYRRVVLLRQPSGTPTTPVQPMQTFPGPLPLDYFDHGSALTLPSNEYVRKNGTAGEFWEDFDFAAYRSSGAKFLGLNSLHNDDSTSDVFITGWPGTRKRSLGVPHFRFGFNQSNGISREFSEGNPTASDAFFLGRYTHEETSHANFNFPQTGSNPFSYSETPDAKDNNKDEVVDALANGPRRGEDLLLSHVHSFEVLVWDTRLGAFVQLGHSIPGVVGDFHSTRNRQRNRHDTSGAPSPLVVVPWDASAFSAPSSLWHVFDTWHSSVDMDDDGAFDPPPYRPLVFYPKRLGYLAPTQPDWDPYGIYRSEDGNRNGIFDNEDINGNGVLDAGEDTNNNSVLDVEDGTFGFPLNGRLDGEIVFPRGASGAFDFYYECVIPSAPPPPGVPPTSATEPAWPTVKGGRTLHFGAAAGDRNPQFVAVPNIVPLTAIQIRVRFLHVPSNKIRQLTLVHSLVDKPL